MANHQDDSFLPFGNPPNTSDSARLLPITEQHERALYRQAWRAYREVNCPYGETDRAMLVWYSFQGNVGEPMLVTGRN